MPRFFFQVRDGAGYTDEEGIELSSIDEARARAVRFVGETLVFSQVKLWQRETWSLDVTNAAGLTLFTIFLVGIDAPASKDYV